MEVAGVRQIAGDEPHIARHQALAKCAASQAIELDDDEGAIDPAASRAAASWWRCSRASAPLSVSSST